jgi:hypothetical protein
MIYVLHLTAAAGLHVEPVAGITIVPALAQPATYDTSVHLEREFYAQILGKHHPGNAGIHPAGRRSSSGVVRRHYQ